MTNFLRPSSIALVAILAAFAVPARAQTDSERAGARAAGLAGLDAYNAGKYEQSLDFFTRAENLMHAPTHQLFLARSHAKLGHLVSAREFYLKLTQDRLPANASKPFRDAQAAGDKELAELEPRVPTVSVVVQGTNAKDVQVTRDGETLPAALLGVPHPEDPGSHTFKATATNMESAPSTITLKEGARETVLLTLNQTAAAATEPGESKPSSGGALSFGSEGVTDAPPSNGAGMRIAGYTGIGLGAVGIGIGTFFLIKSGSTRGKADDVQATCQETHACSEGGPQDLQIKGYDKDANSQRTVGVVGLVAGGAFLATGVTLLILDASKPKQEAALPRLQPLVGPTFLGLRGSF